MIFYVGLLLQPNGEVLIGGTLTGKQTMLMRCCSYCPASTVRQVEEGESQANQQRQATGYAAMHGWRIDDGVVQLGVSGLVPFGDRQHGSRLVRSLRHGDALIAAKSN